MRKKLPYIPLKQLPHSWRSVLERINNQIIDCRAVIAGGAIRDLLLGAENSVKDLDIFVLGAGQNTIKNLTASFGEPPIKIPTHTEFRWPELRLGNDAPLVDLAVMGRTSNVVQLLNRFDIGSVQVAHDGTQYRIHDNFVEDVKHRKIRVIKDSMPDNARERAARMAIKFPQFSMDLSLLDSLDSKQNDHAGHQNPPAGLKETIQRHARPASTDKEDYQIIEYDESILPRLAEAGFRAMHRRNGQYWVMFAKPMTIREIDDFLSTGFIMLDGEPGHFKFTPTPDNKRKHANNRGTPGSKPPSKK
jgi:hypothetical protein